MTDDASVHQYHHIIDDSFDFTDLMTGKEHRSTFCRHIHHTFQKFSPHQRIQAGSGFIHDQQLRPMSHGERQRDFGASPLREVFDFLSRIQIEAASQMFVRGLKTSGIKSSSAQTVPG
jgi:hypothetical protein